MKGNRKIITLMVLASLVGATIVYACNITTGGPCHTASSKTYTITCMDTINLDCDWKEQVQTVTDTTGDGNRIISCGTGEPGLDSTTTGSINCIYDYDYHVCGSHSGAICGTWYDGIKEYSGTASIPSTYCGASGNQCGW